MPETGLSDAPVVQSSVRSAIRDWCAFPLPAGPTPCVWSVFGDFANLIEAGEPLGGTLQAEEIRKLRDELAARFDPALRGHLGEDQGKGGLPALTTPSLHASLALAANRLEAARLDPALSVPSRSNSRSAPDGRRSAFHWPQRRQFPRELESRSAWAPAVGCRQSAPATSRHRASP